MPSLIIRQTAFHNNEKPSDSTTQHNQHEHHHLQLKWQLMELCRQESHSSELHTWVLPILGMMLGSVWPLVRPVDVRALPVCVLRRTPGGRITVGPGMGWRVISKIPESPGAVSSTPTATNTTFIQTEQVEEQKVPAMLLKTKTQSYYHSLGGDQSAAFHFEHVETLKICIYC